MTEKLAIRRCAVYTRKSSDEGLEQEFNSLDAQREAGEAFIKSQAHEGWVLNPDYYDDGGISGGTLDRPGLQRLLADIHAGKINIVVVYKVDRLSRSLSDFAKLVDVFEKHDVSFVSVTQQFNTTTSMGRLMLNVLLSFAQFEREVTGERIRDKILASRKKGMWMGGTPPLGYDVKDRKLIVNQPEAETVRKIFVRCVELGCVADLHTELDAQGIRTKTFVSASGRTSGNRRFSRGHLYHLLKNRVYLSEAVHKGIPYPGEHAAIVTGDLWDQVQALLAAHRHQGRIERKSRPALLRGVLYDDAGNRMTPTHGKKGERRYRYYISQALTQGRRREAGSLPRIPASDLESIVVEEVVQALEEREPCRRLAGELRRKNRDDLAEAIRTIVKRAVVSRSRITLSLEATQADGLAAGFTIELPYRTAVYGRGEARLLGSAVPTAAPNPALVKGVVQGLIWREKLLAGEAKSIRDIARTEKVTHGYVRRVLRFGFLAPDLMEAVLAGQPTGGLTTEALRRPIPLDWEAQRAFFCGKAGSHSSLCLDSSGGRL